MRATLGKTNIKNITLISILVAAGVIFSYVDRVISLAAFPFLPTAKIGIANIVILVGIYRFSFRETFAMSVLKSTLVGLIFASISTFIIGGTATMMSFLFMYASYRWIGKYTSMVGISVIGGLVHIVTQLLVVSLYYQLGEVVLYYGVLLVFVAILTSILVGLIGNKLYLYLGQLQEQ
jgi:heptaprenyl diphosphate synthase